MTTPFSGVAITATNTSSVTLLARWGAGREGTHAWSWGESPVRDMSVDYAHSIVAIGTDSGMEIRQISDGRVLCHSPNTLPIEKIALGQDAQQLILKKSVTSVEFWNLATNTLDYKSDNSKEVVSLNVHPEQNLLALVHDHTQFRPALIQIWNLDESEETNYMYVEGGGTLNFGSGEGSNLMVLSSTGEATIYDVHTLEALTTIRHGLQQAPTRAQFHPDGHHLLVVAITKAQLWDIESQEKVWEYKAIPSGVKDVAISPSGDWFATVHVDGKVRLWDSTNGKLIQELEGQGATGTAIEISPDNKFILTSSEDGTIAMWGIP